jgi:tRNA pseudouridine55 synthase
VTKKLNNSGLVYIDKPAGITSHDVVAQLRRHFQTRRVGHGGTLDPMATGLLIVGIESGTKLLQFVTDAPKSYSATVRLGQNTITDDAEGEVVSTRDPHYLTDDEVAAAFASQVGFIDQVPSSVSAIKINGERAYNKVRAGESVELAARKIEISQLTIERISRDEFIDVDISVNCSKGTYIRAIARDVGEQLKVGGHLTALRRTSIGKVAVTESRTIADAELVPLHSAVARFMPVHEISTDDLASVKVGRFLPWPVGSDTSVPALALVSSETSDVVAIGKPVDFRGEIMLGYHSVFLVEN